MPEFTFKNLTVKVGDSLENCLNNTRIATLTPILCRQFYTYCPSYSVLCRFPTRIPVTCWVGSITPTFPPTCGISEEPTTWYVPEQDLEVLKNQLAEQLAAVEAEQARAAAAAKPSTVEEVDALKAQLQEAMDELDAHRDELTKGASD